MTGSVFVKKNARKTRVIDEKDMGNIKFDE
jgi:hypothetical protein